MWEREAKHMDADIKQVIIVRKDLNMRKGKIAAQVAHASMMFVLDANEADEPTRLDVQLSPQEAAWFMNGHKKVVVSVDSEGELNDIVFKAKLAGIEVHTVTDFGLTEFKGVHTVTCAALGPCDAQVVDDITGNLKLM